MNGPEGIPGTGHSASMVVGAHGGGTPVLLGILWLFEDPRIVKWKALTDLAVAVADGADAISGIGVLTDWEELSGPAASMPATWRVLDRVGPEQLPTVRAARAKARAAAWAAGAGTDLGEELRLDFDTTITIAHSEKQNATATWKKTFGLNVFFQFGAACSWSEWAITMVASRSTVTRPPSAPGAFPPPAPTLAPGRRPGTPGSPSAPAALARPGP